MSIIHKIFPALSPELLADTGIDKYIGCRVGCCEKGIKRNDDNFRPKMNGYYFMSITLFTKACQTKPLLKKGSEI